MLRGNCLISRAFVDGENLCLSSERPDFVTYLALCSVLVPEHAVLLLFPNMFRVSLPLILVVAVVL